MNELNDKTTNDFDYIEWRKTHLAEDSSVEELSKKAKEYCERNEE